MVLTRAQKAMAIEQAARVNSDAKVPKKAGSTRKRKRTEAAEEKESDPEQATWTTPRAGGGFHNLPVELILHIIQLSLHPLENRKTREHGKNVRTLLTISHIDKRMHSVVHAHFSPFNTWTPYVGRPNALLCTLITSPETASKVQHLSLWDGDLLNMWRHQKYSYDLSIEEKKIINAGLKRLKIPDSPPWLNVFQKSTTIPLEHLYAAILLFTPNLTSLEIGGYGRLKHNPKKDAKHPWLNIIKAYTTGSLGRVHNFSHLRKVSVCSVAVGLQDLIYLLRLPALESLKLHGVRWMPWWYPSSIDWSVLTPLSSVRELGFYNCLINTSGLVEIIRRCRALESVTIIQNGEQMGHVDEPSLGIYELSKALLQHRASLQTFQVADVGWRHVPEVLHSLVDMVQLTYLSVEMPSLVPDLGHGAHSDDTTCTAQDEIILRNFLGKLPLSLKVLHITTKGRIGNIHKLLNYMTRHAPQERPQLRAVHLQRRFWGGKTLAQRPESIKDLVQSFSGRGGIQFSFSISKPVNWNWVDLHEGNDRDRAGAQVNTYIK